MKLFILSFFIFILCSIDCLPTNSKDNDRPVHESRHDKILRHNIRSVEQNVDTNENNQLANDGETSEQSNFLLNRKRRCALLRRILDRLSTSGLLNMEDQSTLFNVNPIRRPIRPATNHHNNHRDVAREPAAHSIENDDSNDNPDLDIRITNVNNQPNFVYRPPVNQPIVNSITNNIRVNNQDPTRNVVYFVPSSSASPFIEEHVFVTPPNRDAQSSSSPAPIETNDDWVHNVEPESPPSRNTDQAASNNPSSSSNSASSNNSGSNSSSTNHSPAAAADNSVSNNSAEKPNDSS